ncbi:MAG: ABC transporter ATP-binding protein [Desulfurococcales archaeon]|nr:ABC transporter ATP-binding protein [Desulfurococcales archaeon]
MQEKILEVRSLTAKYVTRKGEVPALRNIDLEIYAGERVAIVGESGSGKTTLASILTRLEPSNLVIEEGEVIFGGRNILEAVEEDLREFRKKEVSVIFQNPSESLDPLYKVGTQVIEALRAAGLNGGRKELRRVAEDLLRKVNLPNPSRIFESYPHELSGGQKQRVAIAIAIAKNPKLLVADEPTTALDVSVQTKILELLVKINEELGVTEVLITHDIGIAHDFAERIIVMYGGKVVEVGRTEEVVADPLHPYTKHLINSLPRGGDLPPGDSRVVDFRIPRDGCPFAPRCPLASEACRKVEPKLTAIDGRLVACHNLRAVKPQSFEV